MSAKGKLKQVVAEIIGDGKLFEEGAEKESDRPESDEQMRNKAEGKTPNTKGNAPNQNSSARS